MAKRIAMALLAGMLAAGCATADAGPRSGDMVVTKDEVVMERGSRFQRWVCNFLSVDHRGAVAGIRAGYYLNFCDLVGASPPDDLTARAR